MRKKIDDLHRLVAKTEQQHVDEEGRNPVVHERAVVVVQAGMLHRSSRVPDEDRTLNMAYYLFIYSIYVYVRLH